MEESVCVRERGQGERGSFKRCAQGSAFISALCSSHGSTLFSVFISALCSAFISALCSWNED